MSVLEWTHESRHQTEARLASDGEAKPRGQVDALVRVLDEERDCEVLHVMSAARDAMNSLMAELLEGHIRQHALNGKRKPTTKQGLAADEVIEMVKSYLK